MENYVLLITVGTFASIIATILVLLTRLAFYRIRDTFPAGSLFHGIANSPITCHIYVLRMKDKEGRGEFITPIPEYSPSGSNNKYESRQLTPWVTSLAETQALSLIFNVLGRIGRTENIELMYADTDYHRWRAPMFILGGSWKAIQALEKCDPYFMIESDKGFRLIPNEQLFSPLSTDEDLGLLQKMINPVTGLPVWVVMGWRGNGTVAAAYALVRWWRYFGKLYGNKPFGLLVSMDDRAGWEQSSIRVIHPEPSDYKKLCHLNSVV